MADITGLLAQGFELTFMFFLCLLGCLIALDVGISFFKSLSK